MNAKIIKTSGELTVQEKYALTMAPGSKKMQEQEGQIIEPVAWALYEDTDEKSGEVKEVLSIRTADGDVLGTISKTFKRDFFDMLTFFEGQGEKVKAIKIIGGTSKSGRKFITCTAAE